MNEINNTQCMNIYNSLSEKELYIFNDKKSIYYQDEDENVVYYLVQESS